MGKLAGNGSAELRSNAYNGCDPFIGGGACHAPHLCRTSRIFILVLGSENLSPRAVNKFHQELNKQLARGFRRKNLIYMIRWAIQFPSSDVSVCLLTEKHFLALWNMNSQTLSAASLPFYVEDIAPLSLLIVIIIFASWGQLEFLMCRVFFFFFSFSCVKLIV